ncbi:MAG: DUF4395 family protein [Candidatus Roizmanbacteria bacterium]
MITHKPVEINEGAHYFCRYALAILLWLAYMTHSKELIIVVTIIFILSAELRIRKAPLIWIFTYFFGPIIKFRSIVVDELSLRFMHTIASVFSMICLIFLYGINDKVGWIIVGIFAIFKTIAALGYCPATKLRSCILGGGSCCSIIGKKNKTC